jgi:hypothetical protein
MLKRLTVALAALFVLATPSFAAGTIPGISMAQQLDELAKPLSGGKLYLIQAGTTSTPQNCYQDTALTIAWPNPVTLDAAGRVPQLFCADGNIKIRLTDKNGVQKLVQDNLLVVGASGGGGGGGTVDPTTILATGDIKVSYGTGVLSGFVRANGRTIGSATSGATERANADTQSLFQYLWGADANLAVSGGRGVSAAADWAANKTITLPDCRSRALAGLDDMGNTAAGRITADYFGSSPTVLGAAGGFQGRTLVTANLPPYTPSGTIANGAISISGNAAANGGGSSTPGGGFAINAPGSATLSASQGASTFTGSAQGGASAPFATMQPTMLVTIYIKL